MELPIALGRTVPRGFDVVGFGLNTIDLIAVVGQYPEPDSKQQLAEFVERPGGQAATAMTACSGRCSSPMPTSSTPLGPKISDATASRLMLGDKAFSSSLSSKIRIIPFPVVALQDNDHKEKRFRFVKPSVLP